MQCCIMQCSITTLTVDKSGNVHIRLDYNSTLPLQQNLNQHGRIVISFAQFSHDLLWSPSEVQFHQTTQETMNKQLVA